MRNTASIQSHSFGVLTLALGGQPYTTMAVNLIRSIRWHSPQTSIAVVTDHPDAFATQSVTVVPPSEMIDGHFLVHKVLLPDLTPFERTVFIDADCLVTRDISSLWADFSKSPVTVWGWKVTDGIWYVPVKPWRERMGLAYIAQHNSGVILFDNSDLSRSIFKRAHEVYTGSDEEFPDIHGLKPDEPALGVALAEAGIVPIDDGGRLTRTHIGMTGSLRINVVAGICRLTSYGVEAEPAIFHCCAWRNHSIYRREAACLRIATLFSSPMREFLVALVRTAYSARSAVGKLMRLVRGSPDSMMSSDDRPVVDSKLHDFLATRDRV